MLLLMDPIPQLRAWAKRLFHIHGKDATIDRALIAQYGLESGMPWGMHRTPGFGDSDWTRIIGDLMRFGFKGSIDIEGWHDPVYVEDLEMTGQVHALKYLKQCRGSVYVPNPVVG
jgi:sugar phosphate isomerase/epimerase